MNNMNEQGVGATEFDLANSQHPEYENKIHHGNVRVPHPTNSRAKVVSPEAVMRAVMQGK